MDNSILGPEGGPEDRYVSLDLTSLDHQVTEVMPVRILEVSDAPTDLRTVITHSGAYTEYSHPPHGIPTPTIQSTNNGSSQYHPQQYSHHSQQPRDSRDQDIDRMLAASVGQSDQLVFQEPYYGKFTNKKNVYKKILRN